jgi:hypothetical protein
VADNSKELAIRLSVSPARTLYARNAEPGIAVPTRGCAVAGAAELACGLGDGLSDGESEGLGLALMAATVVPSFAAVPGCEIDSEAITAEATSIRQTATATTLLRPITPGRVRPIGGSARSIERGEAIGGRTSRRCPAARSTAGSAIGPVSPFSRTRRV